MDLTDLVEEFSTLGLIDALQKYHHKIQISAVDIIQFESGDTNKFYMLSANGTWDEIIKVQ